MNRTAGMSKADSGRMGKGADAFTARITISMTEAFARIEIIAKREKGRSSVKSGVSFPIRAEHRGLKGARVG